MKRMKKIILWIVIIAVIFFIIANIFVSVFAKKIVIDQLEQNLKMRVYLKGISISFPLSVNLNRLEVGDLFTAERISVSPNILGFFAGKILLNKLTLVNPVINLEQSSAGELNLPKLEQKGKPPEVYLASLTVRNAKLIFTDKKILPSGYKIILSKINADISKVMLPVTSLKTNFKLSADLLRPDNKKIGSMLFSGWLDFGNKNMDATYVIDDLDLTYFYLYYGNFISNKKLNSATLNITTDFKAKNNNLDVLTHFNLSNLSYEKAQQEEEVIPELDLTKKALDLFTDSQGNLTLDFSINTKLDSPNITISQLEKVILKAAAKNLANQSPQDLIEKVSNNIDDFKAFGKSLKKIFKGE